MGEVVERLSEIIHEMCSEHEAEVLSLDIQLNQVHLLVEGDPQFGIHRLCDTSKAEVAVSCDKSFLA